MQFWSPDGEHMCSKHVEAWNKTYCKTKILCIKLVNYWDKCLLYDIFIDFWCILLECVYSWSYHRLYVLGVVVRWAYSCEVPVRVGSYSLCTLALCTPGNIIILIKVCCMLPQIQVLPLTTKYIAWLQWNLQARGCHFLNMPHSLVVRSNESRNFIL